LTSTARIKESSGGHEIGGPQAPGIWWRFRGKDHGRAALAHQVNKVEELRFGLADRISVFKEKRPGGQRFDILRRQGSGGLNAGFGDRSPDRAKMAFAGT
jgi:hypothetical protein